jgi:preprotein translocase subunit YajC
MINLHKEEFIMFAFLVDTAHAMGAAPQQGAEAQNPIMSFIPLILIFVIFYFMLIRPQQKRLKEHKAMLESVQKGEEVVTTGGIIGKVTAIADDALTIEIAKDVRVRIKRDAIVSIDRAGKEKSE